MNLGHDAVIVFFILSGFVIAYAVDKKEFLLGEYFVARLSRLYSVLIPALALTLILDVIGAATEPSIYTNRTDFNFWWVQLIMNFTFLQEIQFFHIRYLSNSPIWSLSYEFWYYVIYGLYACSLGSCKKIAILALVTAFVGIKILLLFPLWMAGVALYKYRHYLQLKKSRALILAASSLAAYMSFKLSGAYEMTNMFTHNLLAASDIAKPEKFEASKNFLTDYIVGFLFAGFLIGFKSLLEGVGIYHGQGGKLIKKLSGATFSIYLYHFPLLLFLGAIVPMDIESKIDNFFLLFLVLFLSYQLSLVTESKKHIYKKHIEPIFIPKKRRISLNKPL